MPIQTINDSSPPVSKSIEVGASSLDSLFSCSDFVPCGPFPLSSNLSNQSLQVHVQRTELGFFGVDSTEELKASLLAYTPVLRAFLGIGTGGVWLVARDDWSRFTSSRGSSIKPWKENRKK